MIKTKKLTGQKKRELDSHVASICSYLDKSGLDTEEQIAVIGRIHADLHINGITNLAGCAHYSCHIQMLALMLFNFMEYTLNRLQYDANENLAKAAARLGTEARINIYDMALATAVHNTIIATKEFISERLSSSVEEALDDSDQEEPVKH
jgi:hypothetical protein